jgi:Ran GTPase-activating protein (RanGAP) involved in mRNA processing and transport
MDIDLGRDISVIDTNNSISANEINIKYNPYSLPVYSYDRKDFDNVISLLEKCKNLTSLKMHDIDINIMSPEQLQRFFEVLKKNNIKSLGFERCIYNLTIEAWQVFCNGLKELPNLTSLQLSRNFSDRLISEKLQVLFKYLKEMPNLTSVDLSSNSFYQINSEQLHAFFACLKVTNVTSISISWNFIYQMTPERSQAFYDGLQKSNLISIDLSWNYLNQITSEQLRVFFACLKDSNITTIDLSNNELDRMTPEQWQAFCSGLKYTNFTEINLSKNNLDKLDDNKWNRLIAKLKQSKINKVDFGQDTITNLSAARKKDLANLHLTKIPLDRYQDMNILQFAAKVYGLNCKIPEFSGKKEGIVIRSSWLVAKLISQNILCSSHLPVDITMLAFLEFYSPSDQIFQKPISECKESYDLINQIYNDNPQLRTICVVHSEYFMSPKEEFSKAIDVGALDVIEKYLDIKSQYQQNITTLQLKYIETIAEKYNKQEIVTRIENISKLRVSVYCHLVALTILSDKINNNRYFAEFRFSKKLPNERISKAIAQICKNNNFVYNEDAELISLVSNNIALKDMEKSVAEIAQQISTRFERSVVEEVQTSHAGRIVEQRAANVSAGGRQAEL